MGTAHSMDPSGAAVQAEAAALRESAAACPVLLPGDVPGVVITRHRELRDFLADPAVAKNARHFAAFQRGEIPAQWQLNAFALVSGMTTADGDDHRRLRGLATKAFTPRRVAAMRPWIEKLTGDLLAELPGRRDADGVVDLRRWFAYPLPMGVICELLGVDTAYRDRLHGLTHRMVSTSTTAAEAMAAQVGIHEVLAQVVADRRAAPGEDLTSALIAVRGGGHGPDGEGDAERDREGDTEGDAREETEGETGRDAGHGREQDALPGGDRGSAPERLSDDELAGTLLLMIVAGHETTLNLITNAVRALCAHPEQLALVLAGEVTWDAVVEETLRWDSPVANFPFRYPTADMVVDGVTVPRGTPVLAGYAAAGRDPREYGLDAGRFDVTRPAARHLAFGHGAHYCLGAPLARLEAVIALRNLYRAYPGLRLAVPDATLPPLPGFIGNSVGEFPVRLG